MTDGDEREPGASRPRLLLVEDEPALAEVLADLLESEGYHIECASNGEQVLQGATAAPPDIVVSDVMMPKMSGTQLVAALRGSLPHGGPPVLLLSAGPRPLLPWDNVAFLPKPVSFDQLLSHLRALRPRGSSVPPALLTRFGLST